MSSKQSLRVSFKASVAAAGLFVSLFLFGLAGSANGQVKNISPATPGDAQDKAVFKIPKHYMPADSSDFKGVYLLDPKKPAGMFVAYPNDQESIEAVSQRIRKAIAGMFTESKEKEVTWETKTLPAHPGDSAQTGTVALLTGGTQEVQVVTYERITGGRQIVYGYFAMREKGKKSDAGGRFLDETGKGVKEFDELWKSFGGSK